MSSISLSVCDSNDCKDPFRKFVKEINDLYGEIDSDERLSLHDVEVRVSETFRSLEQKFLEVNLLNVRSIKHLVVHCVNASGV